MVTLASHPTTHPNMHPSLTTPPPCRSCKTPTTLSTVMPDNPNGNAGPPYYSCSHCGTFCCFGDLRGVNPGNPMCDCVVPQLTRVQVAGEGGSQLCPRSIHLCCAVGGCGSFGYVVDPKSQVMTFPSGPLSVAAAVALGL